MASSGDASKKSLYPLIRVYHQWQKDENTKKLLPDIGLFYIKFHQTFLHEGMGQFNGGNAC
jgi:hypothetical protein